MKRMLAFAALLLLLAAPVAATYNFQDSGNGTAIVSFGSGLTWTQNATGGNSFISTSGFYQAINNAPYPFTYVAFTDPLATGGSPGIELFDSSFNVLGTSAPITVPKDGRVEVIISGSRADIYINGIYALNISGLSQNPSHIGYGAIWSAGGRGFDDFVLGETSERIVINLPKSEAYYFKKDMLNPSAYGLYNATTNTLIYSQYMPVYFSRSNYTGLSMVNDSMYLINAESRVVYETQYTGTSVVGTRNFNLYNSLVVAGAPYGIYTVKINGTTAGQTILYKSGGADISFNQDDYNYNDVATITWDVETDYWDTSLYDYAVGLVDSYGNYLENTTLTERSGSFTHTFAAEDPQGAYYAVLTATGRTASDVYWLDIDYAELEAYFNMNGYVNDELGVPISGANVTITQGSSTTAMQTTAADGNYTATGAILGLELLINTTATGYHQYYAQFIPPAYGTKTINITLNSTTPTYTGLGIGGVDRDGVFNSTTSTITSGYGRPIPSATCFLKNTSNSELYSTTTNNAGWYLFDEGTAAFLASARPYDLWCEKIGYGNSGNYTVVP